MLDASAVLVEDAFEVKQNQGIELLDVLTNDEFEDVNDFAIGRSLFFTAASAGTLVKVQGTLAGTVVTWEEAELED